MDLKTRRFQELIEEQLFPLAGLEFRRLFCIRLTNPIWWATTDFAQLGGERRRRG